jgi:hypothetical protein
MFSEFQEIADQIASDLPPRDEMGMAEALSIVRGMMWGESLTIVEGVAAALCGSYQMEA